jgi:PAS domain S-box-containing protein
MPAAISQFQKHQLALIARVTPHAMIGHLLNTSVLAVAVAGSVPNFDLTLWCVCSYAIALLIIARHFRIREREPRSFRRAAARATVYAVLLALPWSGFALMYLGRLAPDQELILVSLGVGMAAAGTVLLSAIPAAAFSYMSAILLPSAAKCVLLYHEGKSGYGLLGVLSLSYWAFLAALTAKVRREIAERKQADDAFKENETRLQEALTAGEVVAFTWDPKTKLSRRSDNASQVLGFEPRISRVGRRSDFLASVHPEDRECYATQVQELSPQHPTYLASFRFVRPNGRTVWLEETGQAEFDADGNYLRLKGLTRDITERKRAEEHQRMLVRELDHRVKNLLASVATVAQRTREGSRSMDDFLHNFDGRIQAMAKAHSLLSRSRWQGVSLADLVNAELAPCVGEGGADGEGPVVLLLAEAAQTMAIVLHELVTNACKYGALSTPEGRVVVRWDWLGDDRLNGLALEWTEIGGPPVSEPAHTGYGIRAVRESIPHELGGRVELAFAPDGLRCRIELPPTAMRSDADPADALMVHDPDRAPDGELSGAQSR